MALRPLTAYPGQVNDGDPAGYPLGKAQNVVVEGDGVGTPWEKDLVNDLWGWQQALLAAAEIDPSNIPDKVGASQYLAAIQALIHSQADPLDARLDAVEPALATAQVDIQAIRTFASYVVSGDDVALGARFHLGAEITSSPIAGKSWGLSSNRVTVPTNGIYEVHLVGRFQTNGDWGSIGLSLDTDDKGTCDFLSAGSDHDGLVDILKLVQITDRVHQRINVIASDAEGGGANPISVLVNPTLVIKLIS